MKKIAIAVLLSAIAAPAFAEGMYVGVNLGQNKYDDSTMTKTTSNAVGVLGGYTFSKNFAAEAAYISLGSLELSPGFTVKTTALSLSGVGSFPISDQFSLFAKLGLAQTKADITSLPSETKSGATFGIGGQYNVTSAIGIRLGYDRYKVGEQNSIDANITSIGGVFKF